MRKYEKRGSEEERFFSPLSHFLGKVYRGGGNGQRVNAFIDKRELWVGVRKLTPVPFSCVACAFAQVDNHRVW